MVGMEVEEGWIDGLRRQAHRRDLSRSGIEAVSVDALALTSFLGVSAHIDKIFSVRCICVYSHGVNGQQKQCYDGRHNPEQAPVCLHTTMEAHRRGEKKADLKRKFMLPADQTKFLEKKWAFTNQQPV